MKLSLIIPTYKRAQNAQNLLATIDNQLFDFKELEVLVVSNFEDEELKSVVNQTHFNNVRPQVFSVGKAGVNASRNYGIQKSQGEIILFLDDDCRLQTNNYLQHIMDLHKYYKEIAVIGGSYIVKENATEEEIAYNCISLEWQYLSKLGDNSSTRLVGGNLSYKSNMLREAGESFDENILYGGSEAEFNQRLMKKGLKQIYIEDLKVLHESHVTMDDLIVKSQKQALARTKYDIDGRGAKVQQRSYQENSKLWALKSAKSLDQYKKIVLLIDLYDWVYQYVSNEPGVTNWKLKLKAKKWLQQRQYQWSQLW